jgi:large subunit ribosomal protein L24
VRRLHIKKGDQVKVIAGKDAGRQGKVLKVFPETNRVIVEKVNFVHKHQKGKGQRKSGILEVEGAIHASNVMVMSPHDNYPTRVKTVELSDGRKVRACRRSGEVLDK